MFTIIVRHQLHSLITMAYEIVMEFVPDARILGAR